MKIIGLTAHFSGNHDNSAALLEDGKITFAESEERISRIKHDRQFPIRSIQHALNFQKLKISDINYFASASPSTNIFKLSLSYLQGFKYAGVTEIINWLITRAFLFIKERLFNQEELNKLPVNYREAKLPSEKLIYVSHHLAHAEGAYHFSGMSNCLVVVLDGYGVNDKGYPLCGSIYKGEDGKLERLEDVPVYASLGLYYGAVTVALGFKLNDGEGKTMGLAAFGKTQEVFKKMQELFPYFNGECWIPRKNWLEVQGISRLEYFRLTPTYRTLRRLVEEYGAEEVALATQAVFEEQAETFFKYLVKKYKIKSVAAAGGVFLNVKMNSILLKKKIIDDLFVYPNPADGGVAVGAAIAAFKKQGGKMPQVKMESTNLGCSFFKQQIRQELKIFSKKIKVKQLGQTLTKVVAKEIATGQVIGWFQGRGEWGPRALGYRSVLADPREIQTKERINLKLKERDWFMPFAPVILEEYKNDFLASGLGTPFMTLTDEVKPSKAKKIPAAVHIDQTARSQIIGKEVNPLYWELINEFYKLTGVPALLNTSFNRHGLPIVHSPKEAIEHLLWGCIDKLVIDDFLITKK